MVDPVTLDPPARSGGQPRKVNVREVINAIFYLVRAGSSWRLLPHDLPPWTTVEWYCKQIRLIPLPAYNPELNPDEFLNHDGQQRGATECGGPAPGQERPADAGRCASYLRSTQQQSEIVKCSFHAPSVHYAMR